MGRKALIVGGGDINVTYLLQELKSDYAVLVAADGGGKTLHELGYQPHILLGDFDSLDHELIKVFKEKGSKIQEFPIEKDWTDLELAVQTVINLNVQEIIIFGGMGDRLDHTLGNLSLLYPLVTKGIKASLIGLKERVFLIGPHETVTLSPERDNFFSLLPLYPGVTGVTEYKAKYPLDDESIAFGSTRGIHNEFLSEPVTVSVKGGYAFLIIRMNECLFKSAE